MTNEELAQCILSLNEEIRLLKETVAKLNREVIGIYAECLLLAKQVKAREDGRVGALSLIKTLKKALEHVCAEEE